MENRTKLLGIDPSFVNMGICLYNPDTKGMILKTADLQTCVKWIRQNVNLKEIIVVIENPAKNSPVFKMSGMIVNEALAMVRYKLWQALKQGSPPRQSTKGDLESKIAIALNFAQKVGENKAAAKYLIQVFNEAKIPLLEVAPSEREKAFTKDKGKIVRKQVKYLKMPTKTTQAQFKELTGYEGSSSDHARDAATLIFGKALPNIRYQIQANEVQNKRKPKTTPSSKNNNFFLVQS